jgi:putative transposase
VVRGSEDAKSQEQRPDPKKIVTSGKGQRRRKNDVSENLMVEGSLRALDMALKEVRQEDELIHHSDRGIQYCCHEYVKMLNARGVRISMTEEDHVYENALAERVNGILKDELGLDAVFENVKEARKAVREAIEIYNNERLHMAIGYEIPAERYEKKAA